MSTKDATDTQTWITAREAGRRLGIRHGSVARVAGEANIRRLVIPGRWTMYHAGDIDQLKARAVVGEPAPPVARTSRPGDKPKPPLRRRLKR